MEVETVAAHGTTVDGTPACCKRLSEDSLIDCPACLEEEWSVFSTSIESDERDMFQLILDTVTASGAKGVTKTELLVRRTSRVLLSSQTDDNTQDKTKLPRDALFTAVRSITDCSVPVMFWTGYSSLVLVASSHLGPWTVQISTEPMTRIFPRRWIDMTGSKVMDLWEAATRAVMGVLVFHPGVTQVSDDARLDDFADPERSIGSTSMATAIGVR